jgi:hypothetical protein
MRLTTFLVKNYASGGTEGTVTVEDLGAGHSVVPSPDDQHLAVREKDGRMASASAVILTGRYERARSLRGGFGSRAD